MAPVPPGSCPKPSLGSAWHSGVSASAVAQVVAVCARPEVLLPPSCGMKEASGRPAKIAGKTRATDRSRREFQKAAWK